MDAETAEALPMCAPGEVNPQAAKGHSWAITDVFGKAKFHAAVGPALHTRNSTGGKITTWFEAKAGGTVSVENSIEAGADWDVEVASLSGKVGMKLSREIRAEAGIRTQVDVPARKIAYAQWGVERHKGKGTYFIISGQCSERKFSLTGTIPFSTGWDIWLENA